MIHCAGFMVSFILLVLFTGHGDTIAKYSLNDDQAERYLVSKNVSPRKFAAYNSDTNHKRKYEGMILGYVTPWNRDGYKLARKLCQQQRLDIVSPVWLQIKPSLSYTKKPVRFDGLHDIAKKWMASITKSDNASLCLITPRLIFEDWESDSIDRTFGEAEVYGFAVDQVMNLITTNEFQGLVLEFPSGMFADRHLIHLKNFLELLHTSMKTLEKILGIVSPSFLSGPVLDDIFAERCDFTSLNAYDRLEEGGIAPIKWVSSLLSSLPAPLKTKTLLGLNFYGYVFTNGRQPEVITNQGLSKLILDSDDGTKAEWNDETKEHIFVAGKNYVAYPSPLSVVTRLKLSVEHGIAGVAIWELGQGNENFLDLL